MHGKSSKPTVQATRRQAPLQQPLEVPSQPLDLHQASSLLLAYESFHRASGRPMLDCKDLLEVPDRVWGMHCCLLLVDLPSQQHPAQQEAQATDLTEHASISYANAPACMLLQPSDAAPNSEVDGAAGAEPGARAHQLSSLHHSPPSASRDASEGSMVSSMSSSSNYDHNNSLLGLPLSRVLCTRLPRASLQTRVLEPQESPHFWWHRGLQLVKQGGTVLTADCLFLDVASPSGKVLKRALLFDSWAFEDGRVGRPLLPAIFPSQTLAQEDLLSAEEDVRAQADAVRALKVQDGLANQDPRVVSAVQRLQELKSEAASIQALLLAYGSEDRLEDRVQTPYKILQGLRC